MSEQTVDPNTTAFSGSERRQKTSGEESAYVPPNPQEIFDKRKKLKRFDTMNFMLKELRQPDKTASGEFVIVDRSLPPYPAPQIMAKAMARCLVAFLDFSEEAKAISEFREHLLECICGLADENNRLACASLMAEFESRMIEQFSEAAVIEVNSCYRNLCKVLTDAPGPRSLPWQSRLLLVSQFLAHCADPSSIALGRKIGAQVACLMHKVFSKNPSRFASMLAGAVIDGSWRAFDGKVIVCDEHSLKAGPEEIKWVNGEDKRSYPVKILQCYLLNNCLLRRRIPMVYRETPGRPGKNYGGQIVSVVEGEQVNPKYATLSLIELALLARFEFGEQNCIITNDKSFAANSPEIIDRLSGNNFLVHISSLEELSAALVKAKEAGAMPVTVAIDERKLLSDTYQDGINHAVNVVMLNEYGMMKVFNPHLLPGMQRLSRMNVQKFYNATLSQAKI
jgi:hypothetical protein